MNEVYSIEDISEDGLLHSRVYEVIYSHDEKIFKINFDFATLKAGGSLIDCAITLADWLDLEVNEKGSKYYKEFKNNEIPINIEQVFDYVLDKDYLILHVLGFADIDTEIAYKFVKPKIHITGDYEPT